MNLSNKAYDYAKFVAQVGLPAFITLYLGLGELWAWESTPKVGASLGLLNAFLGTVLLLNSKKYKNDDSHLDGYLSVTGFNEDTGIPDLQMVVTKDPHELAASKVARLKIGEPPRH